MFYPQERDHTPTKRADLPKIFSQIGEWNRIQSEGYQPYPASIPPLPILVEKPLSSVAITGNLAGFPYGELDSTVLVRMKGQGKELTEAEEEQATAFLDNPAMQKKLGQKQRLTGFISYELIVHPNGTCTIQYNSPFPWRRAIK